MKRPIEVTPICFVLIAVSVIGVFTYGDERGWMVELSAIISFAIVVFVVLGFWLADRLCHGLLVFFAVWAMIRPVSLALVEPPMFDKIVMLIEAGLALPLLVWLFSKRIDAYTKPSVEPKEITSD